MFSFLVKLWGLAAAYRGRLILGIALGVLSGFKDPLLVGSVYLVFAMIFPQAGSGEIADTLADIRRVLPGLADRLQHLVDQISVEAGLGAVLAVVAILPLVMLLGGLSTYGNQYYMQWVAIRSIGDLRGRLYRHVLGLPLAFHQRHSTGELLSRMTHDVAILHSSLAKSFVSLVRDPVTLLVFATVLITRQPKLTLAALLLLPACLVPAVIFARRLRRSSEAIQTEAAAVSKSLHEGLSSVRVVKAYNLDAVVAEEHAGRTRRYNSQFMRMTRASEIPGPLIEFLGSVGIAGLLAFIALQQGAITPAGFLAFTVSLFLMYARIKSVVRLWNEYMRARGASERIFSLLQLRSELPEPEQPRRLVAAGVDIQFERVTFSYGERPLFRDFDLTIRAGQLVALVGHSGSGKTTLTNLLMRFYDPQSGRVTIGGTDLRDVTSHDLRGQIALVTQETILFNDTVRRNIELGRPGATEAEVVAAARHAYAHEFILQTPSGYDTVIGERGGNLSGGQRQRLAIARAILRDAPILVLDEATSSLDTESERVVQAALTELMKGRTTLCIAHRLSTVQHADLIVVLDQGRIAEMGRHQELVRQDGPYRRLYALQFHQDEV
jgi:ATP-binding cassette, subfamily B, bacterial MsbA